MDMDGHALDTIRVALKEWVAQAVLSSQVFDPPTVHLNQWLETKMAAHDMIELSCHLYELMIDETRPFNDEFMPYLRIPLNLSEALDTKIPSLIDIENDLTRESPTFDLVKREMLRYLRPRESYICPVEYGLFQRHTANIHMYYSVSRNKEDRKNNWEYNRNIIAEYYPDGLII